MKLGRNDPCHCGSGKKYKNCHARTDAADAPTLRLLGHDTQTEMRARTLQAVAHPVPWEADVTPIAAHVETHPDGRPAAVMLAAEGLVLQSDLVSFPPSDTAGVAALIAAAIGAQLARGAVAPTFVIVRHEEVASHLAPLLRVHGVTRVDPSRQLPMLDEFAAGLRQRVSGSSAPHIAHSSPLMWAGWKLPVERVHALHVAAAQFYTAKPWELLADADKLELTLAGGSRWYATVMGAAGETFGLALYESLEDVFSVLLAPLDQEGLVPPQAFIGISLTFDFRSDLPKPMRREASDAGWPIAGPSAYPIMSARNTIGGGVSLDQARDLTHALEAIARFADHLDAETNDGAPLATDSWTDPASGTVVAFIAPTGFPSLWDVPDRLSPSLAEGSRADPAAICNTPKDRSRPSDLDAQLLLRFAEAMRAVGTNEKRITQDHDNVAHFIEVARAELGVHLPALSEYDLRLFIYDLMPRKTLGAKSHGNAMRQSLKRFFAYLAASEQLSYPWAASILGDKFALDERWESRPDAFSGDGLDWGAELMEDLAARVMLPEPPDIDNLPNEIREVEAALYDEMQRIWLAWRDEEIRAGVNEPDALRAKLIARQDEWNNTPHPRLGGRTPADAIAEERGARRRISRRRR